MRAITGWLAFLTISLGLAYLTSHNFLAAWGFAFFGLLYCISGVGPLVDKWDASRMRKRE